MKQTAEEFFSNKLKELHPNSDMKEQIYKICTQLNDGQIAVTEATEQLLDLFAVSGSLQDRLFELANDFAVAKQGEVAVIKSLPDHYAGELNSKRIKAYKMLHEQYNLKEGTVRDIFCKGADWYKEQCQEGNVC